MAGDAETQLLEVGLKEVLVPKPGVKVVWAAGVDPLNMGVGVMEKQSSL